jgi:hypothetical protein
LAIRLGPPARNRDLERELSRLDLTAVDGVWFGYSNLKGAQWAEASPAQPGAKVLAPLRMLRIRSGWAWGMIGEWGHDRRAKRTRLHTAVCPD